VATNDNLVFYQRLLGASGCLTGQWQPDRDLRPLSDAAARDIDLALMQLEQHFSSASRR